MYRLSLKKLPFTVLHRPNQQSAKVGEVQPYIGLPDRQQQTEQQRHGGKEVGGRGTDEDDSDAAHGKGADTQQQQQQKQQEQEQQTGSDPDDGSSGGEEDDGSSTGEDSEGSQHSGSKTHGDNCETAEHAADREQDEVGEPAALDAFPPATAAAVEAFTVAIELDPAAFLQPTPQLVELAKGAAKALYDYQAGLQSSNNRSCASSSTAAVLPELYIEGFDAEQIWLQLELSAGPALKRMRKLLKKAGQDLELLNPETEEAIDGACLDFKAKRC